MSSAHSGAEPAGPETPGPELPVITVDYGVDDGEKSVFGRTRAAVTQVTRISSDVLARGVADLCQYVGGVFDQASTASDTLELTGLEVHVQVTGKGEVRLVGAASAEVNGGMKLIFQRKQGGTP
ncbi:Pepco domain-containing protein [Streptomyces sp. NPDC001118]|uniref:Pepco domain-containing protein n=1 Tax=Streptomyces sp. NPDC002589 TaxID=3154420 RepID=UPI0033224BEB